MVPAAFFAAGVFDKCLLLEFIEAAVHGGLRIGGMGDDFRGPATGMLFDVIEYGVKLLFRWDRLAFLALFFFVFWLHSLLLFKIPTQILVNGGCYLRGFFGIQLE